MRPIGRRCGESRQPQSEQMRPARGGAPSPPTHPVSVDAQEQGRPPPPDRGSLSSRKPVSTKDRVSSSSLRPKQSLCTLQSRNAANKPTSTKSSSQIQASSSCRDPDRQKGRRVCRPELQPLARARESTSSPIPFEVEFTAEGGSTAVERRRLVAGRRFVAFELPLQCQAEGRLLAANLPRSTTSSGLSIRIQPWTDDGGDTCATTSIGPLQYGRSRRASRLAD